MNIFTWLILLPIIEFSYIDSGNINGYEYPEYSTEITVGVEAIIKDTIYVKGGSTTYQQFRKIDRYSPYASIYKFETGIRHNGIEAGYYHECVHGVDSSTAFPHVSGGMSKFFIRYGGKL